MKPPKLLARIGFAIGLMGPLLFYVSPFSWATFESRYVCPWCPYIDGAIPTWASWLRLGLIVGLLSALALGSFGLFLGYLLVRIQGRTLLPTTNGKR